MTTTPKPDVLAELDAAIAQAWRAGSVELHDKLVKHHNKLAALIKACGPFHYSINPDEDDFAMRVISKRNLDFRALHKALSGLTGDQKIEAGK